MNQQANRKKLEKLLFLAVCIGLNATGQTVPPGAAALGYTSSLFNLQPAASQIAPGNNGNYDWFSGEFFEASMPLTNFATISNALVLKFTGTHLNLVSEPRDFSTGVVPLLPGSNGFYVEFDMWISDTNEDHMPSVWLLPEQHNGAFQDEYPLLFPSDPVGFEQWLELDVQEGGWAKGQLGTVHFWSGLYPAYTSIWNPNDKAPNKINQSLKHTFGASYNPITQQVAWWTDGLYQMSATSPYVPMVASLQNFYLILSTYSHGANLPYNMYVSGIRGWVPPKLPPPPTDLHVVPPP
jgi:hypothetical protein